MASYVGGSMTTKNTFTAVIYEGTPARSRCCDDRLSLGNT